MTEHKPFRSARAKIARAKQIFDDLTRSIERYDGAALVPEPAGERRICWTVRIRDDPSETWGTIAGDVIHNLRSALDHAAISAVQMNGRGVSGVSFPFADSADDFERQIVDKNFHKATAEAQRLIRELRPYKGGNIPLRALHDLDIRDKHKGLIAISGWARQDQALRIGQVFLANNRFELRDGFRAIGMPGSVLFRPLPMKVEAEIAEGLPLAGEPLVRTLAQLVQMTTRIVEALAHLEAVTA